MKRFAALLALAPLMAAARPAGPNDWVSLSRGPCFGNCPIYEVRLQADGTAQYTGGDYAPRQGRYEGRVDPEVVEALIDRLREVGFWRMAVDRQIRVQDAPEATLTAERRGDRHRVHTNLGSPDLTPILAAIDSVADQVDWRPVQERGRRSAD